ncbi:hypothetical protein AB1K54_09065 [Microbacterium sp. BWT-B31]|uniref:hypothetical protein n=1 Tax=Microbacterium sp. BWT-B31 TaxID=3232072 RepID=UPI003527A70F
MEWTADASKGAWLRERIDDPWRGTMHDFVPRGFPAYARVFHPTVRDRPVGRAWPPEPVDTHRAEWVQFSRAGVQIETEPVTWAEASVAFGTTMHAGAQWHRLVRNDPLSERSGQSTDAAGWRYWPPEEGRLDAAALAGLAGVLASHTTTPDDVYIAVWEGWGGIVGFTGESPARAVFAMSSSDEQPQDIEWVSLRAAAEFDVLNGVVRERTWHRGVLPDEISRGPRLSLPNRDHVLFHGALSELATPEWAATVPWAEDQPRWTHSPSWIWPADHTFAVAIEIDSDSTIVAGSPELIRAVCTHPSLEALPLREGSSLTWDSDDLNR